MEGGEGEREEEGGGKNGWDVPLNANAAPRLYNTPSVNSCEYMSLCHVIGRCAGRRMGSGGDAGGVRRALHRRWNRLQLRRLVRRSAARVQHAESCQARPCWNSTARHVSLRRSVVMSTDNYSLIHANSAQLMSSSSALWQ